MLSRSKLFLYNRYQFLSAVPRIFNKTFLHTYQKSSPPANLPDSYLFYPGRTSMLRMEEFYHSTLSTDLMILSYKDPESERKFIEKRQKEHLPIKKSVLTRDTNPFAINRPSPKSRGNKKRLPVPPKQCHKTIPKLLKIDVHCMIKEAIHSKQHLLSGIMALQCITSERPTVVYSKTGVAQWKLRKDMPIGCKVSISGPPMYTFLDKLVEIVLPRMKEWHGIPITSGDQNGNIAMGFPASALSLFPDIEGNYDMFPLMTGFDVIFNTTAYTDYEGRMLLSGFQIPFTPRKKMGRKGRTNRN
ncbi:9757_t:CDS:2 [Dentiscutata heterogama]|uniref:9757_t:CDS:1 n=1 Tax=Dentiscutata heterogama TaxID=1316150 RepID=A0ACA9LZF1_9GLOM|nr:9757_t:CDS:2 [Dentiscutata heterogama]